MKTKLQHLKIALFLTVFATSGIGQTYGTLTFQFTQTPHTSYVGTKNVMAVWIQDGSGNFIKTRTRYAGWGTSDHLPTWAVNAGGSANNCMSGCNISGATTGATLTSFTTRSITWDGTDASGNLVPDGTYKVTIQSTWNHGSTNTTVRSFTFTKGPSPDVQSPSDDNNFTAISLDWEPSGAGIDENSVDSQVKVYPNPSTDGIFNVDYTAESSIKVINLLGATVYEGNTSGNNGSETIDLSAFDNGIYIMYVSDGEHVSEHKIVLKK